MNIPRRPIVLLFIAFAGGIWLNYYLTLFIIIIVLLLIAFGFLFYKKPTVCFFICIVVLGASYFELIHNCKSPLEEYQNQVVTIRGRIESIQETEYYYRFVVKGTNWVCNKKSGILKEKLLVNLKGDLDDINTNIDIKLKNPQSLVGKDIYFKGRVSLPSGCRNPGLFDYKLYLRTKQIQVIINGTLLHLTLEGKGNLLTGSLAQMKYQFSSALDATMKQESKGLLLGMLFGDKTLLNENIYEDFRRNGTAHILAVSGIHVGIIYFYINRFFSLVFRNRISICSTVIAIALLLVYTVLASFSPSVVRAVTMIGIHIISKHLYCRYDLLCCASFTALIMLIYNPFQLFNVGFQLSFLAVFSLVFLLPIANSKVDYLSQYRRYQRLAKIIKIMLPITVIQIGMIPATAYLFQYISFSAFLLNLPIITLAGFIIPLGIGLNLINLIGIGGCIFNFIATGIEVLINIMITMNTIIGESGFSSMNVTTPSSGLLLLYYGMMFLCTSEFFWACIRRKQIRKIGFISLLIIIFSIGTPFIIGETARKANIVFVDVGQGDCIHIRTPSGKNILIDGGGNREYDVGKNILLPYLLKNGVRKVDLALVTHLHDDHYKGITSLCHLMPVGKLGLYEMNTLRQEQILKETGLGKGDLIFLAKNYRITVEKNIWIDILYPEPQGPDKYRELIAENTDENRSNLLIKVHYKGITLLLTGDMGLEGEEALMDIYTNDSIQLLKADILKVGHHGSRYSTGDTFLQIIDPKIAVIQVGKNNFGHPHSDVIEKLENKDIMIFRTDRQGAVLLDIKEGNFRIRTMLSDK